MKYQPIKEFRKEFFVDGYCKSTIDMIERIARIAPNNKVLAELGPDKQIRYMTSLQIREEICNLGDGMLAAGLKGAHVAIVSPNSVRYVLSEITVSSGVGVVVPIDHDAPVDLWVTLMTKADITAVLCTVDCYDLIKQAAEKCPLIKTLITIDRKIEGVLWYDEIVESGKKIFESGKSVYRAHDFDIDAPAKILFTSGTTGANKGVVMSNSNLAVNMVNTLSTIRAKDGNTAMSILPMHHATEINCQVIARMYTAELTYINDSMRSMMNNIKIFKPTLITVVPMVANAFYRNIWANAEKQGKAEKLRKGIKISNLLRKFGIDKTHEMFADLYAPFGGRLDTIMCGGSLLNPVTVKGLNDIGMHIENAYGITECGPIVSVNTDTVNDPYSVGRPCEGIEVKLVNVDSDGVGDLCVRGKSVAKGYYKDEEATKAVFYEDGFFNTGDRARIVPDGRIYIVGRKKNTIIFESGKNVCPEEIENAIEVKMDYATDIVVYQATFEKEGVQRDVICAGLYIADETVRADREKIAADIKLVNQTLPHYKRINYVEIADEEYPKTSTRKIRRSTLPEKCSGNGIMIS